MMIGDAEMAAARSAPRDGAEPPETSCLHQATRAWRFQQAPKINLQPLQPVCRLQPFISKCKPSR